VIEVRLVRDGLGGNRPVAARRPVGVHHLVAGDAVDEGHHPLVRLPPLQRPDHGHQGVLGDVLRGLRAQRAGPDPRAAVLHDHGADPGEQELESALVTT
jgi:hypothetical protein